MLVNSNVTEEIMDINFKVHNNKKNLNNEEKLETIFKKIYMRQK